MNFVGSIVNATFFWLAVIALLVGMLYGVKLHRAGNKQGVLIAFACAAVLAIVLIADSIRLLWRDPTAEGHAEREHQRLTDRQLVMQGFGLYLVEHFSNQRVLLVRSPVPYSDEDIVVESIRRGTGGKITFCAEWRPPSSEDRSTGEMGSGFTAAAVDAAIAQHTPDVVVTLIGLPYDYRNLQAFAPFFARSGTVLKPVFVVTTDTSRIRELTELIRAGCIHTALAKGSSSGEAPREARARFETTYQILNSKTIENAQQPKDVPRLQGGNPP